MRFSRPPAGGRLRLPLAIPHALRRAAPALRCQRWEERARNGSCNSISPSPLRTQVERTLAALPTVELEKGVEHVRQRAALLQQSEEVPSPRQRSPTSARLTLVSLGPAEDRVSSPASSPHQTEASAASAITGDASSGGVKPVPHHNITQVVLELMHAPLPSPTLHSPVAGYSAELDSPATAPIDSQRGLSTGVKTAGHALRQQALTDVPALKHSAPVARRRLRGFFAGCVSYMWGSPLSVISVALAVGFLAFAVYYVILFGLRRPRNEVRG